MKALIMHLVKWNNSIGPGYYNQRSQFKQPSKKKQDDMSRNEQEVLTFLKPAPIAFNSRSDRFKPNSPIHKEVPGNLKRQV